LANHHTTAIYGVSKMPPAQASKVCKCITLSNMLHETLRSSGRYKGETFSMASKGDDSSFQIASPCTITFILTSLRQLMLTQIHAVGTNPEPRPPANRDDHPCLMIPHLHFNNLPILPTIILDGFPRPVTSVFVGVKHAFAQPIARPSANSPHRVLYFIPCSVYSVLKTFYTLLLHHLTISSHNSLAL